MDMLGDQGKLAAQIPQAILANIMTIQQDLASVDIVEAGQQAGDGTLA